jgi:hypothetical protein
MPNFRFERPEEVNIRAAVGSEPHDVLTVFDEKLVSTLGSRRADFELSIGRTKARESIENGTTLRSVIDK